MGALSGPAPKFPYIPSDRVCVVLASKEGWQLQSLSDAGVDEQAGAPQWDAIELPGLVAELHAIGFYALCAASVTPAANSAIAGRGEQPGWRLEVRTVISNLASELFSALSRNRLSDDTLCY